MVIENLSLTTQQKLSFGGCDMNQNSILYMEILIKYQIWNEVSDGKVVLSELSLNVHKKLNVMAFKQWHFQD